MWSCMRGAEHGSHCSPGRRGAVQEPRARAAPSAWEVRPARGTAGSAACLGATASLRRSRLSGMPGNFRQLKVPRAQQPARARRPAQSAAGPAACPRASASSRRGARVARPARGAAVSHKSFYQQAQQAQQHAWAVGQLKCCGPSRMRSRLSSMPGSLVRSVRGRSRNVPKSLGELEAQDAHGRGPHAAPGVRVCARCAERLCIPVRRRIPQAVPGYRMGNRCAEWPCTPTR